MTKTSEVIRELAEVIEKYGDLPARFFDGAETHDVQVMAAIHRTGNQTFICEMIRPISSEEAELIIEHSSAEELDAACAGVGYSPNRILIAAYIKATARRQVPTFGEVEAKTTMECETCVTCHALLDETLLALQIARTTLGDKWAAAAAGVDPTIKRAKAFLKGEDIEPRAGALQKIREELDRAGALQKIREELDRYRCGMIDRTEALDRIAKLALTAEEYHA